MILIILIIVIVLAIVFYTKKSKGKQKKLTSIVKPEDLHTIAGNIDDIPSTIGENMKQQFVKREVGSFSMSNRGLENKVLTVMNDLATEVNATGGKVDRYEILNNERWGKNISIIFLVTWD